VTHAEWSALARAAARARAERPGVPLALATLVGVEGSSYRQPGARMLCDAEGRVLAGAVSGGCLEGDLAMRAAEVCAHGRGVLATYDLSGELDGIWGLGASCDGTAHLLLEPLGDGAWLAAVAAAGEARRAGTVLTRWHVAPDRGVDVATEFVVQGMTPDVPHVHRLLDAAARTQRPLGERNADGGSFVAPITPPTHLVVVGAARGAEALVRVADALGWRTTVVDARAAAMEGLAVPLATRTSVLDAEAIAAASHAGTVPLDAHTAVCICTHRFVEDVAWLRAILASAVPYVGVLGSRARAARLVDALAETGAPVSSAATRRRLYAPMGLDLGGESPEGIALATVAEIEAVLHGRPGGHLRERRSPIHGRTPTPADRRTTSAGRG
jgi:xanthine dehydrogenase accessory factor